MEVSKQALQNIISDEDRLLFAENIPAEYLSDALGRRTGTADALVFARSTEEVSGVLRYANENGIPVTPRGVTGMPFSLAYRSTPLTSSVERANTSASAVPVRRPSASLRYSAGMFSAKSRRSSSEMIFCKACLLTSIAVSSCQFLSRNYSFADKRNGPWAVPKSYESSSRWSKLSPSRSSKMVIHAPPF